MSVLARLGRHSAIYAIAGTLQRGTAFVLLPLYTHVLTPAEYGTIAIITALNGVLVILLPLALHGAIMRFYFEYRSQPETLREFWGTILVFMVLCCALFGGLLLAFGAPIFGALLGDVAFWPFVVIGIGTSMAQPFFQIVQTIYQAREQPIRFATVSIGHFLATLSLTIMLVVWWRWGAAGPLAAMLFSSCIFAVAGLVALRRDFKLCLRVDFLKIVLPYVLPQIPHGLAASLLTATDKFLLNGMVSLAAAGVYGVAALFSMAVDLICHSANRAYSPLAMRVLQSRDPAQLAELKEAGTALVVLFVIIGSTLAIFANEIVGIVVSSPEFAGAAAFVPFLAFAGVATGIYYVLINILFFDRRATKYIPLGTAVGAACSIGFNFVMIGAFGAMGAAIATMGAQIVLVVTIGTIGYRYERIRWNYGLFALIYILAFLSSLGLAMFGTATGVLGDFLVRLGGWVLLTAAVSLIVWRDPLQLPRLALHILRPQRDAAPVD